MGGRTRGVDMDETKIACKRRRSDGTGAAKRQRTDLIWTAVVVLLRRAITCSLFLIDML